METTITAIEKRIRKSVYFTLCGSCYWCASYLGNREIEACPVCRSERVGMIPVAGNEMFVFHYDEKRGVTMDFMSAKT